MIGVKLSCMMVLFGISSVCCYRDDFEKKPVSENLMNMSVSDKINSEVVTDDLINMLKEFRTEITQLERNARRDREKLETFVEENNDLKQRMATFAAENNDLKQRLVALELKNIQYYLINIQQQMRLNTIENKLGVLSKSCFTEDEDTTQGISSNNENESTAAESMTAKSSEQSNVHRVAYRGKRQANAVAFFSYLDHSLHGLGPHQPIIFNQVTLNEGNGYNKYIGAFVCPEAGIYLFSWSVLVRLIDSSKSHEIWTKLVVNGATQASAVADSTTLNDDEQSSNTVIVRLARGDVVMVQHHDISDTDEIYLDQIDRCVTFSGVLLHTDV